MFAFIRSGCKQALFLVVLLPSFVKNNSGNILMKNVTTNLLYVLIRHSVKDSTGTNPLIRTRICPNTGSACLRKVYL